MNSLTLSGIITGDPQVFAPEGSESTKITFNVANNDNSKKIGGEWQSVPLFIEAEYWTKNPQKWIQKIIKGNKCSFIASLKMESWEQDGNKRSKLVAEIPSNKFPEIVEKQPRQEEPPF